MNSLKDEVRFLFSGQGMPYEKVALMVAVVIAVFFTLVLGNTSIQNAGITVIDLDNSRYSHELIQKIDASPYMQVNAVINTPVEPKTLFYRDQSVAVIYLPQGLEKDRYGTSGSIGVFYDNTNTAQTADIKVALNELLAIDNQMASGATEESGISLRERNLFNPAASTSNGETQGFLFFFSSMFFVFATIGMVPRLRMEGKLDGILRSGNPFDLMVRIIPYGGCLLTALFVGMAILRVWGDMVVSGSVLLFFISQFFYIWVLGMMSLLFGWTAANPGVASSRMILFIPGGFILGGPTGPVPQLSVWAYVLSHVFPLTWEYHLVRDILTRGAGFMDCAREFGMFFIYIGVVAVIFCLRFRRARQSSLAADTDEAMEG